MAASFVMIIGALSVAIVRPYKNNSFNNRDIVLQLSGALFYLCAAAIATSSPLDYNHLKVVQFGMALSITFIILAIPTSLFWYPIIKILNKVYILYRLKFVKKKAIINGADDVRLSYESLDGSGLTN